jgi:hypothetical protein
VADTLLTINDLAQRIASVTDETTGAAEYWSRIFRTFHTLGVMPAAAYDGKGKTATALYDESGLCLARVVASLMEDLSLENRVVREILASLPNAPPDRTVRSAIKGMREGEAWIFHIAINDHRSGRKMHADFRRVGDDDPGILDSAKRGGKRDIADRIAEIVIPAERLTVLFARLIGL